MRLLTLALLFCSATQAQIIIADRMYHLRNSSVREWSSFSNRAENELRIVFDVKSPSNWKVIRIRQKDVKQQWRVSINGIEITNLITDEKDLTHYVPIPEKVLVGGKNILHITTTSDTPDDIEVGSFLLDRSASEMQSAVLHLTILDKDTGKPIPARITILDSKRSMHQVWATKSEEYLAVRPGCIYTSTGYASFRVPFGQYTVFASRGLEYGVDSLQISLKQGEVAKKLTITKELDTRGWISADTHVHTFTHSGHGDATDRERVITLAGEGIELPVITDHNLHVDLSRDAADLGMSKYFTLVTGNEITTKVGHFNVFPMDATSLPIDHRVESWSELETKLSSKPVVVILNHANDIHNNFRPFDSSRYFSPAGIDLQGWSFPANAMEVFNSGSQQTELMQLYRQWMAMLNAGHIITPVGSSDSHDVSRYIVGQGRTYIFGKDDNPSEINVSEAARNFIDGKVLVSGGLFTRVNVDGKYGPGDFAITQKTSVVNVSVEGPSWVKADRVVFYVNGNKVREESVAPGRGTVKWRGEWKIDVPSHDVFVNVAATGPGGQMPFWPLEKPYQPASPDWTPRVCGFSGAIWIDGDRDGKRSTARDYANTLVESSKGNIKEIFSKLKVYDLAVCMQTAAALDKAGIDLWSKEVELNLQQLPFGFQESFKEVRAALQRR